MAMNLFLFDTLVSTSFPSPAPRPAHLGSVFFLPLQGRMFLAVRGRLLHKYLCGTLLSTSCNGARATVPTSAFDSSEIVLLPPGSNDSD